jgi:hypothetical protein
MITENQLRALDFEFNEELESWLFRDITVEFVGLNDKTKIELQGFQLYGINDHRDLSKFIKLVYGS